MGSLPIVEPLDVVEHVGPGFVSRSIADAVDALPLEQAEEALDRRIVITITTITYAAADAIRFKYILVVIA